MTIERFVDRAANIVGAFGSYGTMPDQVDAETLALGSCTHIRHVLDLFIRFVYRQTPDGIFVNITGNGSIPTGVWTPWASAGKPRRSAGSRTDGNKKRAQLTETERIVVREWLKLLAANRRFPLFVYRSTSRRWYVDIQRYDNEADGLAWLKGNSIDAKTFVALKLRRGA